MNQREVLIFVTEMLAKKCCRYRFTKKVQTKPNVFWKIYGKGRKCELTRYHDIPIASTSFPILSFEHEHTQHPAYLPSPIGSKAGETINLVHRPIFAFCKLLRNIRCPSQLMVNIAFNFTVFESNAVWSGVVYTIEKIVGSRMYEMMIPVTSSRYLM